MRELSMDYFYTTQIHGSDFTIDGEEAAHLTHVMRKKEGDEIRIVDGKGTAYDARIESVSKRAAAGVILQAYPGHHEPSCNVTLAVALLKNPSKFDFLVEKVTELGVHEIIPLLTERTIPSHAKSDRWQKLALAAMKQSGRSYLPAVQPLRTLADVLAASGAFDRTLIAHERPLEGRSVPAQFQEVSSAIILIGPEGGFSDAEMEKALAAGYQPWYLGERRLRTETAAVVAAALALLRQA
jgi:16S rRNA (uracil1498-N3)-methyltransferase